MTDKRFALLSAEYKKEQSDLEAFVAQLQSELESFHTDSARADQFIEIVKRHTDLTELTPTMIHEFVEKIVVHEADKSSGERIQQVDIHLNFIGQFDIASRQLTAEEIAGEKQEQEKRERHREAQRKKEKNSITIFSKGGLQ